MQLFRYGDSDQARISTIIAKNIARTPLNHASTVSWVFMSRWASVIVAAAMAAYDRRPQHGAVGVGRADNVDERIAAAGCVEADQQRHDQQHDGNHGIDRPEWNVWLRLQGITVQRG